MAPIAHAGQNSPLSFWSPVLTDNRTMPGDRSACCAKLQRVTIGSLQDLSTKDWGRFRDLPPAVTDPFSIVVGWCFCSKRPWQLAEGDPTESKMVDRAHHEQKAKNRDGMALEFRQVVALEEISDELHELNRNIGSIAAQLRVFAARQAKPDD
jgi:hypothetical protein